jgi:predicted enzyme related to lactoylglutathione lyase
VAIPGDRLDRARRSRRPRPVNKIGGRYRSGVTIGALAQVHVTVSDIDAAVRFYRDVVGVPFLFQVPGQPMAFFQTGDVRLYLGRPEAPEFAGRVTLYFRVDDVEAEQARLTAAGVAFEGAPHLVHRDGGTELWMSLFHDPDGNNLLLMEERAAG